MWPGPAIPAVEAVEAVEHERGPAATDDGGLRAPG